MDLEIRDHFEAGDFGEGVVADRTLSRGGERAGSPVAHAGLLRRHFAFFPGSIPGLIRDNIQASLLHVLRTERAAVAGLDGAIIFKPGWVDRIQLYYVNYGRPGCQFTIPQGADQTIAVAASGRHLAGAYFLGFNAGYTNYAHWMSDQMPGLVAYRDFYMSSGCRLLLPVTPPGHFIDQTMALLGIPEEKVDRIGDEVVSLDTLFFLSYFKFNGLPDYAAEAQRVLKAAVGALPQERSRRILISRPDSPARRLLNEAELVNSLRHLDLDVVAPGRLSVADQVRAFHAADLVVGLHGAGLVNCGFCAPGSSLLEIFSEFTTQSHFWTVASTAGMTYGYVAGTSFDQDWSFWSEFDNWDAPYVVDASAVAAVATEWSRSMPTILPLNAATLVSTPPVPDSSIATPQSSPLTAKSELVAQFWYGKDPFTDFPAEDFPVDLQGWNSDHAFLVQAVDVLRPRLVVEVGVWKGCSVITMADRLKAIDCDGAVLAIDTWLGAWDHWLVEEHFQEMGYCGGQPSLFGRFMKNIVHSGLSDYVVPMPLDSINAFEVLNRKGMLCDLIHIDAGHDYVAVSKDLESWWLLLRPGGVLIADDYFDDENKAWPQVKQAVDDFVANHKVSLRHERGKAWIDKPTS